MSTGNAVAAKESGLLRQIAPECAVFAATIIACGFYRVLWWYPWEDQAAHQYMAWGLFHGMRPYVEAIDMNWPGIVLIHVAAYLMAGTASWGIRGLDLFFQFLLLSTTAFVLAAWRVPRPMRLLVGCGYLLSYLATGWWWTAEREGFNWPLWVVGAVPFMLALGPEDSIKRAFRPGQWFAFGLVMGLSLWIKPTPALPLVMVVLLALLLCDPQDRAALARGVALLGLGMIAVSAGFVIALAMLGSLGGFMHWGISYAVGGYGKMSWPWSIRFVRAFRTAVSPGYRPVTLALAVIGLLVITTRPKARSRMLGAWRRPLITAVILAVATAAAAMLQGKPGLVYQFVPMRWSFALLAGAVWGVMTWNDLMRAGTYLASTVVIAGTFFSLKPMGPTAGTGASWTIRPMLKPDDEVVMWGASATLLAGLEHRTPFPIVGSAAVYWFTPPGSPYRREILSLLAHALRDPPVKFLLIEQGDLYSRQPVPEKLWDILESDPGIRQTIRNEYRLMPGSTVGGFDVLEHIGGAAK